MSQSVRLGVEVEYKKRVDIQDFHQGEDIKQRICGRGHVCLHSFVQSIFIEHLLCAR